MLFTDTSNFLFFLLYFGNFNLQFAGAESENYSFNGWSESAKSIVRQFRVLPFYLSALNQTIMKLCSTHWAVAFKTQREYRIRDHFGNNTESKYKSKSWLSLKIKTETEFETSLVTKDSIFWVRDSVNQAFFGPFEKN